MLFNSLKFVIFLPIVFIIYWILPNKLRWILLLVSSYLFYMSWNIEYLLLLFLITLISYFSAIIINKNDNEKNRKVLLIISLLLCLSFLFVFKYFNFISDALSSITKIFSIELNTIILEIALPIGISFYTFQAISYLIDVYRKKIDPEVDFRYYAIYISFFPQILAGPINRANYLIPQLKNNHTFDYDKVTYGLKLMAWGYIKKACIADTIAVYVNSVYDSLSLNVGFPLLFVVFVYSIQIYCDFSGYSDMAIGISKLFGIDLVTNFKSPYFSGSIKEFWSRWHISLSTWLKDYIYIPLGGNRCNKLRHYFNLFLTFLVSGLWHGANWNFILWGGIHGLAQIVENIITKRIKRLKKNKLFAITSIIITFVFCSIVWVFFRANSIDDSVYILTHMFKNFGTNKYYSFGTLEIDLFSLLKLVFLICVLIAYDYISLKTDVIEYISNLNTVVRWIIYMVVIMIIFLFSNVGGNSFIYFQF